MVKSVKTQMYAIFQRSSPYIVFMILLTFVLINYFHNLSQYKGCYIFEIVNPLRLSILEATNEDYNIMLIQYLPFMLVLPAGFSFVRDIETREIVYISMRVSKIKYYIGKFIAVFLSTFIVFVLPLFIEMLLNNIAFTMEARGNPFNISEISSNYMNMVDKYFLSDLYITHPYLYYCLFVCVFGAVAGTFAVFTLSLSMFIKSSMKAFLFLPAYLFTCGLNIVTENLHTDVSTNYYYYLRFFDSANKNGIAYACIIGSVFLLSLIIVCIKSKTCKVI